MCLVSDIKVDNDFTNFELKLEIHLFFILR